MPISSSASGASRASGASSTRRPWRSAVHAIGFIFNDCSGVPTKGRLRAPGDIGVKIKKSRFLLLCACLTWGQARAHDGDSAGTFEPFTVNVEPVDGTFTPFVAAGGHYVSNLFAMPSAAFAQSAIGTTHLSDYFFTETAGTDVDWKEGRQEVVGRLEATNTNYATYHVLDNTSHDIDMRWNWVLGDSLKGDVGVIHQTQLGDLTNIQAPINDTFTNRQFYFDGQGKLADRWRMDLSARDMSFTNSALSQQPFNLNIRTVSLGPEYYTDTGKSVAWVSALSNGGYPNVIFNGVAPVTDRFTQYDNGVKFEWGYLGKLRWSGNLNYTRYMAPNNPGQDFDGATGTLNLLWAMTGKTNFTLSGYRNILPYDTASASFQVVTGTSLTAHWQAREKLELVGRLKMDSVDYTQSATIGPTPRHDRIDSAGVELAYTVLRHTRLVLSAQRLFRNSNIAADTYNENDVSLGLEQRF